MCVRYWPATVHAALRTRLCVGAALDAAFPIFDTCLNMLVFAVGFATFLTLLYFFFLTQFLSSNWSNFSFGTKRGLKSQILVEKFAVAKKPAMRTEIITDDLTVCDKITHNAINFGSRMLLSKLVSLGELSKCNIFYD